jgi:hypothetical protein
VTEFGIQGISEIAGTQTERNRRSVQAAFAMKRAPMASVKKQLYLIDTKTHITLMMIRTTKTERSKGKTTATPSRG